MYRRLLDFLCCPACGGPFELDVLAEASRDGASEISEALLHCPSDHWYPVVGGIPRLLPDALRTYSTHLRGFLPPSSRLLEGYGGDNNEYDRRTQANFNLEWQHYQLGDKTWGMELDARVRGFFLKPLRLSPEDLEGKVVLDAGCGNGSQSVVYTEFGAEVIAMDLSSGLERGYEFRHHRPSARPECIHFVQADLQAPPLRPGCVDVIHSVGVLHHTPDTERTFRRVCKILRPTGHFYVWVYKYEPMVTPLVNGLRRITTRVPSAAFARIAGVAADPFRLFTFTLNALGVRRYVPMTRREAALGLMDIFGAPYAHYHSVEEVSEWFRSEGFTDIWDCNHSRRGFGVCGWRNTTLDYRAGEATLGKAREPSASLENPA
ncbi:MAG: methyltransferase domain-containing protein [Actinomycetota bacterium]|nr:methyltransferase domain-containing protein [Actinomycetota bacterium]